MVCAAVLLQIRCSLRSKRSLLLTDDDCFCQTNEETEVHARGSLAGVRKSHQFRLPTIFTLHYLQQDDSYGIEHNCVLAAESGANMVVITDNFNYTYCSVCRCTPFERTNCPAPSRFGNNCEKLSIVQQLLSNFGEFIYLDSDLVVMKPQFFYMFAPLTFSYDFVAPLAEAEYLGRLKHHTFFNSGLMFIRAVPGVNHSDLVPRMYRLGTGSDQSIITYHVRDFYNYYDNLSLQWHCRRILKYEIDIDPKYCVTIHDRSEIWHILSLLNQELRKADSLRSSLAHDLDANL